MRGGIDTVLDMQHRMGNGLWLRPQHPARRAKRIDTDVAQRPAAGFRAVADIGGIGVEIAEHPVDMPDFTNHALTQQRPGALPLRMVDDHIGLGQLQPAGIARCDELVNFRGPQRDRPFDMQVVGQRDVYGVNLRVSEQGFITVMHAQIGAEAGEFRNIGGVLAGKGGKARALCGMNGRRHCACGKM